MAIKLLCGHWRRKAVDARMDRSSPASVLRCLSTATIGSFQFVVERSSAQSLARTGSIVAGVGKGVSETPCLVRRLPEDIVAADDRLRSAEENRQLPVICNASNLSINPGVQVAASTRLHKFFDRSGLIFTQAGSTNLQRIRLAENINHPESSTNTDKVLSASEDRIIVRNGADGTLQTFSPEACTTAQQRLGGDIISALDYRFGPLKRNESIQESHRWQERCQDAHRGHGEALYGIVHGFAADNESYDLSVDLSKRISALDFDGYFVSADKETNFKAWTKAAMSSLPLDAPRHVIGVPSLDAVAWVIEQGADTIDSDYAVKLAKRGSLLTNDGPIDLKDEAFENRHEVLRSKHCSSDFTLAYLHHLVKAHEPLAWMLCAVHNIEFMDLFIQEFRDRV